MGHILGVSHTFWHLFSFQTEIYFYRTTGTEPILRNLAGLILLGPLLEGLGAALAVVDRAGPPETERSPAVPALPGAFP